MEFKDLWCHPPVGKFINPDSSKFTYRKYFFELKKFENSNNYLSTTKDDPEHQSKMQAFIKWVEINGVNHQNLHYPTYFTTKEGFKYPGMSALTKIQANQAYVSVPSKLMLTTQYAYNSELKPMFKSHPEVFTPEAAPAWEDYILISYIMWQMSLGKESFWYPLFAIWPDHTEVFYTWTTSELNELQDKTTKKQSLAENDCLKTSWNDLFKILRQYPKYFPQHM